MHKLAGFLIAAALTAGLTATASAQPRPDRDRDRDRGGWHDRDIHRFHDRDFDVWRTGRWFQGRHGGRLGWWWVLGDAWYYYPEPIYPYPDPYVPPVIAPPPGPPRQLYYYCARPRGYFPYVQSCVVPWREVPG